MRKYIFLFTLILQLLFGVVHFTHAQTTMIGKDIPMTSGWSGMIPCGNTINPVTGGVEKLMECGFDDLVVLVQNIITYLIFYIAAPIACVMFAYAGYLMLTNNGNESQVTKAKQIFGYVFAGLVVSMAAWLIVKFILDLFLGPSMSFRLL